MARKPSTRRVTRYSTILENVFFKHYSPGMKDFPFERSEFTDAAEELDVKTPKNLGDIVYSVRYRTSLPPSIVETAAPEHVWIIRPAGRGVYRFVQIIPIIITPNPNLSETRVPDSTPGIITMYSGEDEQALLAKLRYNRLVDLFTGVTCYSLQNHLRTTVPGMGQVETDEIYVGLDSKGAHYVFPIQAKGSNETLGIVQIEQDLGLCLEKFPNLIPRAIGAQFAAKDLIAMFEFEEVGDTVRIAQERHYRLVPPDQLSPEELLAYRQRLE